jgi:hypothetical protein
MIQNVTNTAWVMPLRSLNKKSLLTTASPTPQAKVIRDGDDGFCEPRLPISETKALQLGIKSPSSHSGQAKPFRSVASYVPMSNEENPLPGLINLLGDLIDGDTMADLVSMMAEPEETAALLSIGAMEGRIERRMLGEGVAKEDADRHSSQVAEEMLGAWTALHRRQSHA